MDPTNHRHTWHPASLSKIERVHTKSYIDQVNDFAEAGGGFIEQDTVVSQRSFEVALMAAGAVCDAVERLMRGEDQRAFCLVRPPGHHALTDHSMGFCLFNNVAVGAMFAVQEFTCERVLIVDWDVHHGNGTQATFWNDPDVAYFSMHRSPFYPHTGNATEIGAGAGLGTTKNLPTAFGTPRAEQLQRFERELTKFADEFEPQLILISAGFDAHKDDPIGSLGLESDDFGQMTRVVVDIANKHADGRIVSVLEGGYNPDALAECIEQHLQNLTAFPE